MIISSIVACGNNLEIGFNNSLLWHIPSDFKNFKKITSGHHLVMGRKTFESIGKPLPNRTTIVLSRKKLDLPEGVLLANSPEAAIEIAKKRGEDELFICGGESIYKIFLEKSYYLYISKVNYSGVADAFFPDYQYLNYDIIEQTKYLVDDKTPIEWEFFKLKIF